MTPQTFFRSLVSSDTLHVSVALRGTVVALMKFNGKVSQDDVMGSVRRTVAKCRGIATVTLRNASSGQVWKQTLALSPQPTQLHLPLF